MSIKKNSSDKISSTPAQTDQMPTTAVTEQNMHAIPTRPLSTDTVDLHLSPVSDKTAGAAHEAAREVPVEWHRGDLILGLYEVRDIFTGGATAIVYRVYHRGWNIELAVKSPKASLLTNSRDIENFEREAQTWVNLGLFPYIVTCYYVRRLGGIPRLFAEYVDGGDLATWIHTRELYAGGPEKALERILDIALQSAWALDFAHRQGLIHQDIKPGNILMTREGAAKVTDFGLAKAHAVLREEAVEAAQSLLVTCGGMTPAYCSPEQALVLQQAMEGMPQPQRTKLTLQTDIWSWAVTVFEMLTGSVLWDRGDQADTLFEQYAARGVSDPLLPRLPGSLAALLRQCLQQDPGDRLHGMQDAATALAAIYREITGHEYFRPAPRPAVALADNLNNRAVSLVDLWQQAGAEQCWQDALTTYPHHPESIYNRGLMLWRTGRLSDDEFLRQLEESRPSDRREWKHELMLAQAYLERGDSEKALHCTARISQDIFYRSEVQAVVTAAMERSACSRRLLRTLPAHRNAVSAVCISSDARSAFSGGGSQFTAGKDKDFTIHRWDLGNGACLQTMSGHSGRVTSLCISAEGRHLVSGSIDATLRLWDAGSGTCLRVYEGHGSSINAVCFTGDACHILSAGRDATIKLWDLATGRCIRTFEGHSGKVTAVTVTPDGQQVISGSDDRTLKLWDLHRGTCLRTYNGHTAEITAIALTADGRHALSGSEDLTLRIWDIATGNCVQTLTGHAEGVAAVAISRDGTFALSGGGAVLGREHVVKLWETTTGRCLYTYAGHTGRITGVCLSQDGSVALSGSEDMTLRLWQISLTAPPHHAPLMLSTLQRSEETAAVQMQYNHALDEARNAFAGNNLAEALRHLRSARAFPGYGRSRKSFELWSGLYTRLLRKQFSGCWEEGVLQGHDDAASALCVSADDTLLVSGGEDAAVKVWRVADASCLLTCTGHAGTVFSVCSSSDNRYLWSGSADATVKCWDAETGTCHATCKGHTASVTAVCISPDNLLLMSGSDDTAIRIWDTATGTCRSLLRGHVAGITALCASPDGRFLVSGSGDTTIRVWDIASGRCLRTFEERTSPITALWCSPDFRYILSGSADCRLRLWETDTGRSTKVFTGHKQKITSICMSADSRFALSGGDDKQIALWELASGRCLHMLEAHAFGVTAVAMSRNGRHAFSAGRDSIIKKWALDWELAEQSPSAEDERLNMLFEIFLTVHTPRTAWLPEDGNAAAGERLPTPAPPKKPSWSTVDFENFVYTLKCAGYGWLQAEDIHNRLLAIAAAWSGPSPPVIHGGSGRKGNTAEPFIQSEKQKGKKRSTLRLDTD